MRTLSQNSKHHRKFKNYRKDFTADELTGYLPTHPTLSDIYSRTHLKTIPFHKFGKRVIFRKSEIDTWLLSGQSKTLKNLIEEAEKVMIHKHNKRRKVVKKIA